MGKGTKSGGDERLETVRQGDDTAGQKDPEKMTGKHHC